MGKRDLVKNERVERVVLEESSFRTGEYGTGEIMHRQKCAYIVSGVHVKQRAKLLLISCDTAVRARRINSSFLFSLFYSKNLITRKKSWTEKKKNFFDSSPWYSEIQSSTWPDPLVIEVSVKYFWKILYEDNPIKDDTERLCGLNRGSISKGIKLRMKSLALGFYSKKLDKCEKLVITTNLKNISFFRMKIV